jgi:hypothetical protein
MPPMLVIKEKMNTTKHGKRDNVHQRPPGSMQLSKIIGFKMLLKTF